MNYPRPPTTNNPKRTSRLYAEMHNRPDHLARSARQQERDRVSLLKKMRKNAAPPMPLGVKAYGKLVAHGKRRDLKKLARKRGIRTFFRRTKTLRVKLDPTPKLTKGQKRRAPKQERVGKLPRFISKKRTDLMGRGRNG